MARPPPLALLVVAALTSTSGALMGGCEVTATQLVIVVDTDYESPEEMAHVRVRVGPTESWNDAREVRDHLLTVVRRGSAASDGQVEMPFSFGVTPRGGDPDRRVHIEVEGYAPGDVPGRMIPRAVQRVITGFVARRRLRVPMFLWRSCEDVYCDPEADLTCVDGACRSASMSAEDFEPVKPGEELGGSRTAGDGGVAEAGPADAGGVDSGGLDARLPLDARPDAMFPIRPIGQPVALYHFDAEDAVAGKVQDRAGHDPPMDLVIDGASEWVTDGLLVNGSGATRLLPEEPGLSGRIYDHCTVGGELTLEAWLRSADGQQGGPARIVSFSEDNCLANFTLGQGSFESPDSVEGPFLSFRLRTTDTEQSSFPDCPNGDEISVGAPEFVTPHLPGISNLMHVVVVHRADDTETFFIDGQRVGEHERTGDLVDPVAPTAFNSWDPSYTLVLGNELNWGRPWHGILRMVAIYCVAASEAEIGAAFGLGPPDR